MRVGEEVRKRQASLLSVLVVIDFDLVIDEDVLEVLLGVHVTSVDERAVELEEAERGHDPQMAEPASSFLRTPNHTAFLTVLKVETTTRVRRGIT